jgi:hypothetical protein
MHAHFKIAMDSAFTEMALILQELVVQKHVALFVELVCMCVRICYTADSDCIPTPRLYYLKLENQKYVLRNLTDFEDCLRTSSKWAH